MSKERHEINYNLISVNDERAFKDLEKRKYRQELDYLVSIKRRKDDVDYLIREKDKQNFNHKAGLLRDEENNRNNKYNNLERNVLLSNIESISNKREQSINNKIANKEEERSYLNYLNKIKLMEEKSKEDERNLIKKFKEIEFHNHLKNKKTQIESKIEGVKENRELIDQQIKKSIERENEYKNKINHMNNRIFQNVSRYNEYVNNSPMKENFIYNNAHNNSDLILNKQLAEMKKESPNVKQERIKERQMNEENYQTIVNKIKSDNEENKKLYKGFLDYQVSIKQHESTKSTIQEVPQTLLPSYFHENRPIATYKKAADTMTLMKNSNFDNSMDSLNNIKFTNKTNWETNLDHNPITHPIIDINYNKYLKNSLAHKKVNEFQDLSKLQNVANSIIIN